MTGTRRRMISIKKISRDLPKKWPKIYIISRKIKSHISLSSEVKVPVAVPLKPRRFKVLFLNRTIILVLTGQKSSTATDYNYELRTTDYGLRTTDYGLRTTHYELRTTDYGLRTTDYGLRTTDYGLRTTDYGLRTTDYGLRT